MCNLRDSTAMKWPLNEFSEKMAALLFSACLTRWQKTKVCDLLYQGRVIECACVCFWFSRFFFSTCRFFFFYLICISFSNNWIASGHEKSPFLSLSLSSLSTIFDALTEYWKQDVGGQVTMTTLRPGEQWAIGLVSFLYDFFQIFLISGLRSFCSFLTNTPPLPPVPPLSQQPSFHLNGSIYPLETLILFPEFACICKDLFFLLCFQFAAFLRKVFFACYLFLLPFFVFFAHFCRFEFFFAHSVFFHLAHA